MTTAAERELATWTLTQVERFRPTTEHQRALRATNARQLRRYLQAEARRNHPSGTAS